MTNIINVGEMGTGMPYLLSFAVVSLLSIFLLTFQKKLYVKLHFFLFLLFISWISTRVIIDTGELEFLKQITIATTGGMLFFYFVGVFVGITYHGTVISESSTLILKAVFFLFFIMLIWMLYSFGQRMRSDIFYMLDVDGSYQRSGNFLSISFITISFLYLVFSLKHVSMSSKLVLSIFWFFQYTILALMALIGSQMFGSNSASAVILGVYLITLVMTLVVSQRNFWNSYIRQKLSLPWSKSLAKHTVLMSLLGGGVFLSLVILLITVSKFDVSNMRFFGFGSSSNTSLLSRFEILVESGAHQLSYAPFMGNINVAYLTTGDSGKHIHSFFPYVMANLGIVGLVVVLMLFISIFVQLYREGKSLNKFDIYSYQVNIVSIYSIFIMLYIILFASLATDVSWAVLWFSLGLTSKPLGFR